MTTTCMQRDGATHLVLPKVELQVGRVSRILQGIQQFGGHAYDHCSLGTGLEGRISGTQVALE